VKIWDKVNQEHEQNIAKIWKQVTQRAKTENRQNLFPDFVYILFMLFGLLAPRF
jgi:hypothetical protein